MANTMMKRLGAHRQSMNRKFVKIFGISAIVLSSISLFAQYRGDDSGNYEGGANRVSAGGAWTQFSSEDRMTAAKRTRFELQANNAPNSDDSAKVILYCANGKLTLADFHPGERLSRPNWPGFWGQPQMRVRVRVDGSHDEHSWNWIRGHFLAMDKGTARELIGAQLFRVEFQTPDRPQIAEFAPAGLDLKLVKQACGITPKKP